MISPENADMPDIGISDQQLLNLSAREVAQMFVNYSPEEVKAIKHKRRTLKNREYAAICRNRRTTQREELIGKCREYEIQIKNIKKQNAMFENTQKKVRQMLEGVVDYEPFQSFNTTEDNKSLLDLN